MSSHVAQTKVRSVVAARQIRKMAKLVTVLSDVTNANINGSFSADIAVLLYYDVAACHLLLTLDSFTAVIPLHCNCNKPSCETVHE